jgi:hypothetical protein
VELPGDDHLPCFGDQDAVVALTQEFLTGNLPVPDPDRMLATVLFTDIVDSTRHASELDDAAGIASWRSISGSCGTSWGGSGAGRSRRPGMGSWRPLTVRPGRSEPPMRSGPS